MRLEQLTPAHVRRAMEIYNDLAWPPQEGGKAPYLPGPLTGDEGLGALFKGFEQGGDAGPAHSRRYTLRMGNSRYPFMKFVVQEFLVNGEFFFSVDTHDNLEVRPGAPDYAAWEELKVYNRELRDSIEERWSQESLPTNHDLQALVEELAQSERESSKRRRLLIVDDDVHVARGLQALLSARGYEVELAHDGRAALERLAEPPRPDLVLLDYEMPALDGEEVLARMRQMPRLAEVPVLLATAADIELERLQRVSGFLRKPYPRHVLFEMIARLIGPEEGEPGSGEAGQEGA